MESSAHLISHDRCAVLGGPSSADADVLVVDDTASKVDLDKQCKTMYRQRYMARFVPDYSLLRLAQPKKLYLSNQGSLFHPVNALPTHQQSML